MQANVQEPAVVCRAERRELRQVPENMDEPRQDISDASRGAAGIFGVRKEDEGRQSALLEQEVIVISGKFDLIEQVCINICTTTLHF